MRIGALVSKLGRDLTAIQVQVIKRTAAKAQQSEIQVRESMKILGLCLGCLAASFLAISVESGALEGGCAAETSRMLDDELQIQVASRSGENL